MARRQAETWSMAREDSRAFIRQAPFSQSMRGIELAHGVNGLARGLIRLVYFIRSPINFRLQGIGSAV